MSRLKTKEPVNIRGPYNRVCIAASRQPNFYLLRLHAAPQYRLEIVFPGSRETPAVIQKILYFFFGSRSSYTPAVKNAQSNRKIR